MSTDSEIRTERLRLLALTAGQLALLLNDPERLERELALTISREQLEDPVPRAIGMKLAKMAKADPKKHSWYTYWLIVVDRDAYGAGMIGFKGQPDAIGEVEIGYGIDLAYRRQGYMTEAVQALIAWAFDDPTCLVVTAQKVLKSNIGSQRVLLNAGLHVILEEEDTQDWRIERPHWPAVSPPWWWGKRPARLPRDFAFNRRFIRQTRHRRRNVASTTGEVPA